MTEPLTPANCDLQDFKFMPVDAARLRDSDLNAEQTPEENWAAFLLWLASWHQVPAASVPDSDDWLAQKAGYKSRGRIDPRWKEIKAGAMRGFVLCTDGRYYHPVVAEKAIEAWNSKLDQRWRSEVARIKKHNERHGTDIQRPSFEAWVSQGCPQGQRLPVPYDKMHVSQGQGANVTDDKGSKGQREGQGQRQGNKEEKAPRTRSAPTPNATPTRPEDVAEQTWTDFLTHRKAKKAPVTVTVLDNARREAKTAGMDLDAFLQVWCLRGSQGLLADWIKPHERQTQSRVSFAQADQQMHQQRASEWMGRGAGAPIDITPNGGEPLELLP